jgi:exonuclease III
VVPTGTGWSSTSPFRLKKENQQKTERETYHTDEEHLALRIAAWNANGLQQSIHEIEVFLWDQKKDICLISETHLTKEFRSRINGYKIYHTIRPDKIGKGGSAMIIKENIKHYQEANLETCQMQVTTVSIQANSKNITVAAI